MARLLLIASLSGSALLTAQSALAEENLITLNLKGADIRAFISTVSKFTGKNFVVDPRVKAKITVVSSKTMSENEVYEVFLSVLQVHGYAVPEVNAKQGPLPVVRGATDASGDALITKVITLDHVPAAQLVPILRPLVPQQGHLAAYNPTNTLIITDHAANIRRLIQIIRNIDRPESDELEIIPLKHASASELVRILNSLQSTGAAKAAASKKITLAADDRTNSILMSGERASRLKIRATIAHLDTPLENEAGNTHVIYLKYAKAKDLAAILSGVQKKQAATSKKKAPKAIAAKKTAFDIQADEATNALIITAGPDIIRRMKSIIRQLDIRRAQVLIESIIAEINTNRNKDFSSQLASIPDPDNPSSSNPIGASTFGNNAGLLGLLSGDTTAIASAITQGITLGAAGVNGSNQFAFILRALTTDAATNILSTPNIVTMDNQEASIVVAQNVPFLTGSFTTNAAGATNPFQTIERQDVGITLKVTPQINDGNTIKLDIDQETSSVSQSAAANGGIITNRRAITTSVLIEDGEILILGGLIEETLRDQVSKVPLLGDIPLLGWLFRSHTSSKDKQNLMIFIRPSIMRDAGAATFHTNRKYNYLRAQQIDAGTNGFGLLKDENTPILPPIQDMKVPMRPMSEKEKTEAKEDAAFFSDDDDAF